eukprot:scaffold2.g7203.t1
MLASKAFALAALLACALGAAGQVTTTETPTETSLPLARSATALFLVAPSVEAPLQLTAPSGTTLAPERTTTTAGTVGRKLQQVTAAPTTAGTAGSTALPLPLIAPLRFVPVPEAETTRPLAAAGTVGRKLQQVTVAPTAATTLPLLTPFRFAPVPETETLRILGRKLHQVAGEGAEAGSTPTARPLSVPVTESILFSRPTGRRVAQAPSEEARESEAPAAEAREAPQAEMAGRRLAQAPTAVPAGRPVVTPALVGRLPAPAIEMTALAALTGGTTATQG